MPWNTLKNQQKTGLKFVEDNRELRPLLVSAFRLLREIPCVGSRLTGICLFLEVNHIIKKRQHFTHLVVVIECFVSATSAVIIGRGCH